MTIQTGEKESDNPIRILAIDTTAKECSICITSDGTVLTEYNFLSQNDLSSKLISLIDFLLAETQLKLTDIDCFGIGTGPGIFTGIRVGLSSLKGLLFNRNKRLTKIVPVNTLMALQAKYSQYSEKLLALRDAKRGQVYVAGYETTAQGITPFMEPALVDHQEILSRLKTDGEYGFAGCGAEVYREAIRQRFPDSSVFCGSNFLAAEIAAIAYRELLAGRFEQDIEKINPLYIRKTDAEENYERNRIRNDSNSRRHSNAKA